MVDLLGEHRAHDAEVVRHFGGPGEEIGDVLPALAVALELGEVSLDLELLSLQLGDGLALGEGLRHGLAVELVELRLVVEGLEVGGSARHAEENDALDALLVMGEAGEAGVGSVDARAQGVPAEKREQGGRAEADPGLSQEGAAGEVGGDGVGEFHVSLNHGGSEHTEGLYDWGKL